MRPADWGLAIFPSVRRIFSRSKISLIMVSIYGMSLASSPHINTKQHYGGCRHITFVDVMPTHLSVRSCKALQWYSNSERTRTPRGRLTIRGVATNTYHAMCGFNDWPSAASKSRRYDQVTRNRWLTERVDASCRRDFRLIRSQHECQTLREKREPRFPCVWVGI